MVALALIKLATGEIVSRHTEGSGWVDLPGVGQVSPPVLGWEGDGFKLVEVVPVTVPAGKQISGAISSAYDATQDKVVESATFVDLPPRRVAKSVIISRLDAAGKLTAAMQALQSSPAAFAKWTAPDQPSVNYNDPATLALLQAIGADATTVMAE